MRSSSLLPPRLRRSRPKNPSLRLRLKSSPHKLKLLLPRLAKRPARSTSPVKNVAVVAEAEVAPVVNIEADAGTTAKDAADTHAVPRPTRMASLRPATAQLREETTVVESVVVDVEVTATTAEVPKAARAATSEEEVTEEAVEVVAPPRVSPDLTPRRTNDEATGTTNRLAAQL